MPIFFIFISDNRQEAWSATVGATEYEKRLADYDPYKSNEELEKLELPYQDAVKQAVENFEKTLALGVRDSERWMVKQVVESMEAQFPEVFA
ncbi:MAG: hypothetical protein IH955_08570 [Chloroflexi bacterium]|nr:hypothetical protein [Chloroflexota bacterium]